MTVVSSKEFADNQQKYFDMAVNEDVCIRKDENIFIFSLVSNKQRKYKQPDEDFYRAISMDEFRKWVKEDIHQIYSAEK